MARRKERAAARQRAGVPYPTPTSDRCHTLMLGVIEGLGKLPTDDDWIEDRVLACLLVAWGELAAMQDGRRREEIIGSLTTLGRRVVAKLMVAGEHMTTRAESTGQSIAEILLDAVREGTADEVPLPRK